MPQMTEIKYRGLKRKDFKPLMKMMCQKWDLNTFSKKELICSLISQHYLFSYLAIQSFAVVAECDHIAVGINTARCEKTYSKIRTFKYRIRLAVIEIILKQTSGGRLYLSIRQVIKKANSQMLQGYSFDGEGLLLMIDKNLRGQGIGRHLQYAFTQYATQQGAQKFYFFTDEFCDVGFWNALGYQLLEKTSVDYFRKKGLPSEFFMYGITGA